MNKIDLLYGCLIGIAASFIGSYIFIVAFTEYNYIQGINILQSQDALGKLITLGAVLNLIVFFVLLKLKKDMMARGVVLALIILTIITLLV